MLGLASGVLTPDAGTVTCLGLSAHSRSQRKEHRSVVGWVSQRVDPIRGFTVTDQVAYAGWLKGLSVTQARAKAESALEAVELEDLGHRKSDQLSGGEMRRLGIAQALVHDCRVLLLDEPTAGLDPAQKYLFRHLIGELQLSRSIVIATHQTEDLADLADHVLVLDAGKVLFAGAAGEFIGLAQAGLSSAAAAEAAYLSLIGFHHGLTA